MSIQPSCKIYAKRLALNVYFDFMLMKQSPSKQQCSEQFLKTTGSTFLPFPACRQHTGMEVWQKYYPSEWHISETETRKLAKGGDSRQAPVPLLSLFTLLRHQSLCFPNALTWHWATPCVEALGDQTYSKMRFWGLVQILAVHCRATGRAFPCKIANTIAIFHLQSPCWFLLLFLCLALLNWLPSLGPSSEKCFCRCLKPSDFNGSQACASVLYWLGWSNECIPFPPVLSCTKFCTFIVNYLV